MPAAFAFCHNDVAHIVWSYEEKIEHCLGFAVHRLDEASGRYEVLPAWVGFAGGQNDDWNAYTTAEWPVQKFKWRDLTARPGKSYRYRVVPMIGTPDDLSPDLGRALMTQPITLRPDHGDVSVWFNRGIIATQATARSVPKGPKGGPNPRILRDRIDQPGDPLRKRLAGQILDGLTALLERAEREDGTCYAALYELSDPELLQRLLETPRLKLVLSNTGEDDATNQGARQTLHESGIEITDRMLGSGRIGHNKFIVYCDRENRPRAVLTGSTNWTATGICGQANNCLVIENGTLAEAYHLFWQKLRDAGDEQPPELREWCAQHSRQMPLADGGRATVWFSPNTKTVSVNRTHIPESPGDLLDYAQTPADLKQIFRVMAGARDMILFLLFQPGSPSILEFAAHCSNLNDKLIVYGAATDPQADDNFWRIRLVHRDPKNPISIVVAAAIGDQFGYWEEELLKLGHAVIHDKIVVVDPLDAQRCAVITGSHNLGFKASHANDENLVILRGRRDVALAYAAHVLDIHDHYRWRSLLAQYGASAWTGLAKDDAWQDKYFRAAGREAKERAYWLTAAQP